MVIPRAPHFLLAGLIVACCAPAAHADLWCAAPLWVHEWGVHVFDTAGAPGADPDVPSFVHTRAPDASTPIPVRQLPADSGIRKLPVLHVYAPGTPSEPIPLGLEVGFTGGPATTWFPQVDRLRPPGTARQLIWDRLELTPLPRSTPARTTTPWVRAARAIPNALWANRAPESAREERSALARAESERFIYYEAATRERVPLVLTRAPDWHADRPAYTLTNVGPDPVHDVFLVHRARDAHHVVYVARLAPHAPTRVTLGLALTPTAFQAATSQRLRAALGVPPDTSPPVECVTDRNPAIPFERADGHGLFPPEIDLLLDTWRARFFEQPGTTILYREAPATLDRVMPLSLYTSMHYYIRLQRTGMALWQNVQLP